MTMELENNNNIDWALFVKTEPCRRRDHMRSNDAKALERCNYWHTEDDRFVLVDGKRMAWTPAIQSRLAEQHALQAQAYAAKQAEYQARKREEYIARLKTRPNYKTAPCQLEEEHDIETCAFHHGDVDFNKEAFDRIQAERAALRSETRPNYRSRSEHDSARRQRGPAVFDSRVFETVERYDTAFPPLGKV